jgi:CubicO group peptidase (beta-lactamase class C family)
MPQTGRPFRRFATLFRRDDPSTAPGYRWWATGSEPVWVPEFLGSDARAASRQRSAIQQFYRDELQGRFDTASGAALLAGLRETAPEGETLTVANDAIARDRQWWLDLKQRLYGPARAGGDTFVCPRPLDGPPAPVLTETTPEEAGVSPEAIARIDAACAEWLAKGGQPFCVCAAYRGHAFFHRAYGTVNGRPMSREDKQPIASTTKMLSGISIMMLADAGRVALDDRIDKYLPVLRPITIAKPVTVRHLFTHTSGINGWVNDSKDPDFEERVGLIYPFVKSGDRWAYSGLGLEVGGKVIETVSGEALRVFYRRHLLDPLGCMNIDVEDCSGGGFATALDLAKVGQMMLNGGAYGNMRFMEKSTVDQMMPGSLEKLVGYEPVIKWGIGLQGIGAWMTDKGFYGHGGYTGSGIRFHPEKEVVVTIARESVGAGYDDHLARFLGAVLDAVPAKSEEAATASR